MANTTTIQENTVLASSRPSDSYRWTNSGKPKIIEFYGFEGEDFCHFLHLLKSFFALSGITNDIRKVSILRAQLRRVAAVFLTTYLKKKTYPWSRYLTWKLLVYFKIILFLIQL
jgi:hypothetical protein